MCVCVCVCVREGAGRFNNESKIADSADSKMKAKKLHWTGGIRATQMLTIIPSNIETLQ